MQSKEQLKERAIQRIKDLKWDEYRREYARLGVSPEDSERLLNELEGIVGAKLDQSLFGSGAAHAQAVYESEMRTLLGDKYADYQSFEEHSKARFESGLLNEYILKGGGAELSPSEQAKIQDAIYKYAAYSDHTRGDIAASVAFGELPQPKVNDEAVAEAQRVRDQLASAAALVVTDAKTGGLSQAAIDELETYYGDLLSKQDHFLAVAKDPVLAQREAIQSQLKSLRSQPPTDAQAARIEVLQRRLNALPSTASGGAK